MTKESGAESKKLDQHPAYLDRYSVLIQSPDRAALAEAIHDLGLDIDHQHPEDNHDADKNDAKDVCITGFLTQPQIDELTKRGWKLRIETNLSEVGRERQKEVGRGDRFAGGKIAPKGLGRKLKEVR